MINRYESGERDHDQVVNIITSTPLSPCASTFVYIKNINIIVICFSCCVFFFSFCTNSIIFIERNERVTDCDTAFISVLKNKFQKRLKINSTV